MLKYDVRNTFDGEPTIFGHHLPKKEAESILSEEGYIEDYEIVSKIEHVWVTSGMMPEDIREEEGQHGWWVIDNPEKYKRKKKATLCSVKRAKGIPEKCPNCRTDRIWLCEGKGLCNQCGTKFGYQQIHEGNSSKQEK
ncbi:MAG: hypothetical protein JRI71_16060 [Deltaproteobacteria bacterium]|nr:hypothetical protein [Deltaproteobacteria bacterium]